MNGSELGGAGFLGTQAPLYADLVLLLEIGMGLALLGGAILARAKKFRWHAVCQSAVVLLNFALVAVVMAPSFHSRVIPRIPARIRKPYFAWATAHAALGSAAELAALYIVLAAGTNVLPERFRLRRYKLWMRVVLVLWCFALGMGMITYARWYLPGLFRKAPLPKVT